MIRALLCTSLLLSPATAAFAQEEIVVDAAVRTAAPSGTGCTVHSADDGTFVSATLRLGYGIQVVGGADPSSGGASASASVGLRAAGGGDKWISLESMSWGLTRMAGPGGGPHVKLHAINTKGAGSGDRMSVPTNAMAINTKGAGAERMAAPATAMAINTKGTGASNGRMAASGEPMACDSWSLGASNPTRVPAGRSSCTLTGGGGGQAILVGLLLPAVQKIREAAARGAAATEEWELSLVPHAEGAVAEAGTILVPCTSPAAKAKGQKTAGYDLKAAKKV